MSPKSNHSSAANCTKADFWELGRQALIAGLGEQKGQEAYESAMAIGDMEYRKRYFIAMIKDLEEVRLGRKPTHIMDLLALKHQPVPLKQFIEDPYFMDAKGVIYPVVMECMEEMNNGMYQEAVLTGAIGTGKSTIALYSVAYQLYLLSCYRNPHALFELDPSSEIVFIFQSINASLAKSVDFDRFKTMVERSPYFLEQFPFQKDILSELKFPNRIIVKPVSGSETGAIGQNVIGGLIDELNYMALVQNSKTSTTGGDYDQAVALYTSIAKRRKSRFMKRGVVPGLLCLVSSKRYPGQFTDTKIEEAKREIDRSGKSTIYVYDKRTWDIKPAETFSGEWFRVFIGDMSRRPRILGDREFIPEKDSELVLGVPEEYRSDFETDIMSALRDVGGVSTLATHPFIVERDSVYDSFRTKHRLFSQDIVDFAETRLSIDKSMIVQPDMPRFVHIDLAVSNDSAGFCIGTVLEFVQVTKGTEGNEVLPKVWIDAVLGVKPPRGGEILFYKIREVIHTLRALGMNIRWVTFDQFQSVDSMQLLRQAGLIVGRQSMDTTTNPYDFTKNALYDRRVSIPHHNQLAIELISLEKDVRRNKIDHPPRGSKDIADALAGVVYGLTTRREIWAMHGISLASVPETLRMNAAKQGRATQQTEETDRATFDTLG